MPLMYFHLRDGEDHLIDPDGSDLPDMQAAKKRALVCAFDILAADIRVGKLNLNNRIEVEDAAGNVLHTLNFRDLVEIEGLQAA